MISRLRGVVVEQLLDSLVVECGGVGYEIFAPSNVRHSASVGSEIIVQIRQVVREDGWFLFGFVSPEERQLFDQLREVKGCGPKTSMALLDALGANGTIAAIQAGDYKQLARANGIGVRLAERIAVDLRDKVGTLANVGNNGAAKIEPPKQEDPVIEALMNLGFRRPEATAAADSVRDEADDEAGRLRAALRRLRSA
ncbi:MAG: Holliday junction branch migration protein RuvA [Fimbriimonadaceae bacterium]|nr:Holliday junction branch migration protein RuvA [Fimbriimonadaceae bacterium]